LAHKEVADTLSCSNKPQASE